MMSILQVGQIKAVKCKSCGHYEAEVHAFKTICLKCGASINPFTGEVYQYKNSKAEGR